MWNKYCKKVHPIIAYGPGISHVWKKLIEVRVEAEHQIWWQLKAGNSILWYDNWTKQGALYFVEKGHGIWEEMEVKEFIVNGQWNLRKRFARVVIRRNGWLHCPEHQFKFN